MILTLFFSFLISAEAPKCPTSAKLNPKQLMPEAIRNYAQAYKLKSPEELICCIANMPNIAIAISPNSIAAQNGDYTNPRVLIVSTNGIKMETGTHAGLNAIFSINSGAAHLNQKDSVEMMLNAYDKLVYTDIDFSKHKAEVSKRNPESCMLCHGDSGAVPIHGPRPIFDPAPWPRFLIETPPATSSRDIFGVHVCPERAKLEPLLEKKASEALENNPRYACIKDKPRIRIDTLDSMLSTENNKRLARIIRSSPEYNKFKYAIAGAEVCTFIPEDFIPDEQLKTMTDVTTITSISLSAKSPDALINDIEKRQQELTRQAKLRDAEKSKYKRLMEQNKKFNFSEDVTDSRHCSINNTSADTSQLRASYKMDLSMSKNTTFSRYMAEGLANETQGVSNLRFLFESRGIDISNWGMSLTDPYVENLNINDELLNKEPSSSPLKRILSSFMETEEKCELLKAESLKAFGVVTPQRPTEHQQEVIQ